VAGRINTLLAEGRKIADKQTGQLRPMQYGDIAILLRSAKFPMQVYSRILTELGIPCYAASRTGFFTATETNDLLSILNLLDNQMQDIPMAAYLLSPIAALPQAHTALATIRCTFPQEPFHQAVVQYAQRKKDELAGHLNKFLEQLQRWRDKSLLLTVADLLWEIISETGYLAFCRSLPNGRQRRANVLFLHRCARRFGSFQRQGLYRFMAFLKELEESGDVGQPAADEAGNAVRVMTVHGSKGLEFPVVFLCSINTRFNLNDTKGAILLDRDRHLALQAVDETSNIRYPTAANWIIKDAIHVASLAEELRILYVAMTRAQENLELIGSLKSNRLEQLLSRGSPGEDPLVFRSANSLMDWLIPLSELPDSSTFLDLEISDADEIPLGTPANPVALPDLPAIPSCQLPIDFWTWKYPHHAISESPASTSVTGLSKGDEIPQITRMDYDSTEAVGGEIAAERGTAVHRLLELLDFTQDVSSLDNQIESLLAAGHLTRRQVDLIERDEIRWLISDSPVAELFKRYADSLVREIPLLDSLEQHQSDPMDRVMLRGRIDAVAPTDEGLVVIDYKTDRVFPEPGSTRHQS